MKKYNDEHFTVRERRTHKKICDCGSFEDARMMMGLDGPNREIVKNKVLMDQVVDIEITKALPTNEIVVNMDGGVGGSWKEIYEEFDKAVGVKELKEGQLKLPESELEPLNLS
jgi:hypothetical protein